MIVPALQDDAFLADVAAARRESDALHVWWLGQSGFLVQAQGRHLLFDPYLSDSLTRKYATTDKPHVRMTARIVAPERLDFIDVVTSSHNHTDHLDAATLQPLLRASRQARLVAPAANRAFVAERLGADAVGRLDTVEMNASADVGGFRLTAVPAAHEEKLPIFAGFVVRAGPWVLYHSGDTMLYPGMAEGLRPFPIDVAFLPINGRAPERRVAGNLSGSEAAVLAHDIRVRWVLPCHYEMFEFNTASSDEFVRTCEDLAQPYRIPRAGARTTFRS